MWIEIFRFPPKMLIPWSRPARALWIEINCYILNYSINAVEAREGLVD